MSRGWRVLGTGISFAVFGLAGLVLSLLVLPVVRRRPGTARERQFRCQYVVHRTFHYFVRMTVALGVLDVEVHGAELLRQPGQLVVANHPTLLDVVFLVSLMPQADCVVKREAWSNPFMRGVVRGAGYLPNDLGDSLVDAGVERLQAGRSLLVFPEGTRSKMGALGPFRRGAAHMALRSGRPLRPALIRCDPPSLMRGQKWYDVPERRMHFTVECCEEIAPGDVVGEEESRGAGARKLTAALRDFYGKKLQTPRH
jgi:1-acyl-sn-glycerol-3-phosphate acyltransferase